MNPGLDRVRCEVDLRGAVAGDEQAKSRLFEQLWPFWLDYVRASRSLGRLSASDDHVHNVVSRIYAKLCRDGARVLGLYPSWQLNHPEKNVLDWLRIVSTNVTRDYVREVLGTTVSSESEPSPKRLLNEAAFSPLADELGCRPPYTETQTVRQIVEYAQRKLTPLQVAALSLWLNGQSVDELDQEQGLAPGRGRRALRSAVAALRRQFRAGWMDEDPASCDDLTFSSNRQQPL